MTDRKSLSAANQAVEGDRDDVRTVIAWMVAVNGRLQQINEVIGAADLDLVQIARARLRTTLRSPS